MNHYIHPLQQHAISKTTQLPKQTKKPETNFQTFLKQATELKISKHAQERMMERNIKLNDEQWQLIRSKVFEAKQKGVTDALVVVDDATLIVSAKNNTVVTALNKDEANNKIFTNINGTILL